MSARKQAAPAAASRKRRSSDDASEDEGHKSSSNGEESADASPSPVQDRAKDKPSEKPDSQGWTDKGEIAALLAKFTPKKMWSFSDIPNEPESMGGLFYVRAIDAAAAKRLGEILPESSLSGAQNQSPTVKQFIQVAQNHPHEVFLHGYVVPPPRHDERVSFEGCHLRLPKCDLKKASELFRKWLKEVDCDSRLEVFEPCKAVEGIPLGEGEALFYAWWD